MRKFLALAALAAGLGACGGVDDRTEETSTLAQLRGVVSDPSNVGVRQGLRLALVWFNKLPDGPPDVDNVTIFAASDELAISPSFPAGFTLNLTEPPPPEAINEWMWVPGVEGGPEPLSVHQVAARNAQGLIVLYEDRNGNGHLDLVGDGATEFADDVVGMAHRTQVTWLEGDLPAELTPPGTQGQPADGFNLIFALENIVHGEIYPGYAELHYGVEEQLHPYDWRTLDEAVTVELDASSVLDLFMCGQDYRACLQIIAPQAPGNPVD